MGERAAAAAECRLLGANRTLADAELLISVRLMGFLGQGATPAAKVA